jgi:hypothetical protein
MANANARYHAQVLNALSDENSRLTGIAANAAQAVGADVYFGQGTQIESDAVLAIANARLTAQTDLIAALSLL